MGASDPYEFVSADEIAGRLDVRTSTVREWVRKGILPRPVKLGNRLARWTWESILASVKARNGGRL